MPEIKNQSCPDRSQRVKLHFSNMDSDDEETLLQHQHTQLVSDDEQDGETAHNEGAARGPSMDEAARRPEPARQRSPEGLCSTDEPAQKPAQAHQQPREGLYSMPESASTPVTLHFDALLECLDLIASMEEDDSVDKQDALDSLRSMLNNMLSTVMMHSFSSSMSVRGWRVE